MPQLIEKIDLEKVNQLLVDNSDFSFEMVVLRKLIGLGFKCKHSGTYVDSIKLKNREFDIRGIKEFSPKQYLHAAVECKNISENNPLIVHTVPRQPSEAFHNVLLKDSKKQIISDGIDEYLPTQTVRVERYTPYIAGKRVGKSIDQAVFKGKPGEYQLSDGELFDRCSQALAITSDVGSVPILANILYSFTQPLLYSEVVPS